jgi:hypothetical protein
LDKIDHNVEVIKEDLEKKKGHSESSHHEHGSHHGSHHGSIGSSMSSFLQSFKDSLSS